MSAVPAPLAPMPTALAPVRDEELARQFDVTEFVRTEYPRVVSAVRMIAGDREAAVDAVQEALVQLLTDQGRAWPRNVAAWVTVVASNALPADRGLSGRRHSGAWSTGRTC